MLKSDNECPLKSNFTSMIGKTTFHLVKNFIKKRKSFHFQTYQSLITLDSLTCDIQTSKLILVASFLIFT